MNTKRLILSLPLLFTLAACETEPQEIFITVDGCCDDCDDTGDTSTPLPIAVASAQEVDVGLVCQESGVGTFEIKNVGEGVLELGEGSVSGEWILGGYPTEVQPGESITVEVIPTSSGSVLVEIPTNDPNNPTIQVTLHAQLNEAPTLTLGGNPLVVAPGDTEVLQAMASDESPAFLAGEWRSDMDGTLSTDSPDSTGLMEYVWDGTQRSSGWHQVEVQVTDECGLAAIESFQICQNEGYTEENLDLSSWTFTGSAQWDATNEWVELTDTSTDLAGTAFMTAETVQSDNVSIAFRFYAGDKDTGADGFSLTAIDTTQMTTYVGSTGGGIGYGNLPGWSIEVDTFDNTASTGYSEPIRADHVAVVIDGASTGVGVASAAIHEVEDGNWHDMVVQVVGQDVTVSIDGIVYINQTVPEIQSFPAQVGFTAATGSRTNYHLIDALEVEGFICDEEG